MILIGRKAYALIEWPGKNVTLHIFIFPHIYRSMMEWYLQRFSPLPSHACPNADLRAHGFQRQNITAAEASRS